VLLLGSVRAEPGAPVPFELGRALPADRLRRLRVGPLSPGALHELLLARLELSLDRAALARVHESSGGNPFFALELGRELVRRGAAVVPGQPLPLPDDVRALVRDRLARLPAGARSLLLTAAALPRPTVGLLEAAVGDADAVADDLTRAVQAGVVELDGERVLFRHPLLASACSADVPPRRCRAVHARLAEVVADPEARARHLALAVEGPDETVAGALEQAAGVARDRGAPQASAELWTLAADLTPAEDGKRRRRRLLAAADLRTTAGDLAGARLLLDELAAGAPPGPARAELLLRLARARSDDRAEVVALCERALAEPRVDDRLRSRAHCYLGLLHALACDVRRALAHARLAVEHAERSGDDALVATALSWAARIESWALQPAPGLLVRALELEARLDPLPAYDAPSTTLGCRLVLQDRLDEARTLLEARLAHAQTTGDELAGAMLLLHLTELECRAGDWPRADRHADAMLELNRRRGLAEQGSMGLYARALVDAHFGRVDECRAAAEQGIAIARASGDAIFELQNRSVLGFLALSLGDLDAAAGAVGDLPDRLVSLGWDEPTHYAVWPTAIEALVGLGSLADARRLLAAYRERADASGSPWALATAARCAGLLAAAEGDLETAREELRRALAAHERTGPFERARTLLAAGLLERRAKRKRAAREAIESALATFDRLGASLWVARAQAELTLVGGRPPAGLELTAAERRVADLVAAGRKNREVAAALHVSVHTVESQLRSAYAKLGVRSRTELARLLAAPSVVTPSP
jgi:DNA-binding CsgD family transcriptional regulator